MKNHKYLSLLAAGLFLLVGCSTAPSNVPVEQLDLSDDRVEPAFSQQRYRANSLSTYHFLLSELALMKEDLPGAQQHLAEVSEASRHPELPIELRRAGVALRRGKIAAALKVMNASELQEQVAQNSDALLLRAALRWRVGDGVGAMQDFSAVLARDPVNAEAALFASVLDAQSHRGPVALERIKAFESAGGSSALLTVLRGRIFEQQQDYEKALEQFKRALRDAPDLRSLHLDILRAMLRAHRTKEAFEYLASVTQSRGDGAAPDVQALGVLRSNPEALLSTVTELSPGTIDETDMRMKYAAMLLGAQEFDAALTQVSLVLGSNPNLEMARYYRATLLAGSGRRKEAIGDLLSIQEGRPLYLQSHLFAASLYLQRGMNDRARALLEGLARKYPADRNVYRAYLALLQEQREWSEALALIDARSAYDTDKVSLALERAVVLRESGDKKAATAQMFKVLELDHDNPDALNYIAYELAERGGDLSQALSFAQQAVSQRAEDGYFLDTLGWIYHLRGEQSKSVEILRQAYEASQGDMVVAEHYGDALTAAGKIVEAKRVYREALEHAQDTGDAQLSAEERAVRERLEHKLP